MTSYLKLAGQGKLKDSAVLEHQVRRMLADPRAHELVKNFAGQWLQLRTLQSSTPEGVIYPDFDDNLRQAFRTEAEMFFESIVREDRSTIDLLNADYTFVNERLAVHYGIPERLRQPVPAREARRRPGRAPRAAGEGRRRIGHLGGRPDFAGAAGQMGAHEYSGHGSARSAAQRAAAEGIRRGKRFRGTDYAPAYGAAPRQSELRKLPPDDGPDRLLDGELRRDREVAHHRSSARSWTPPASSPTAARSTA